MFAALVLSAFIAFAATPQAAAADCSNPVTQFDLTACANEDYLKTDAALNKLYRQINGRLKGDDAARKLLTASQRAWIAFRDAECAFATSAVEGGSIQPMLRAQCLDALTAKRAEDFKVYLKCEEGDLSCPVPAQ
ncbi:MAG: DUF1311 domain-containing protein [Rhizobiales bacterium]|nr:DUF1311 domain-containing protein [Hyphomicrobiales bacterium]